MHAAIEQLRFYNRTCGIRSGPYLTFRGVADNWAVWNVTVIERLNNSDLIVTIKAHYTHGRTRCEGYIASIYGSRCRDDKAKRATMSSRRAEQLRLAPVADGSYRIIFDREGGCNRFLSMSDVCATKYSRILSRDAGRRSRWIFTEVQQNEEELAPVGYVSDWINNLVHVCYDADLENCIPVSNGFRYPTGIAVTPSLVLIANKNDSIPSISVCTDRSLRSCSKVYAKPFVNPTGIAVLGDTVYITNPDSNTVDKCSISGDTLVNCRRMSNGFSWPWGVTARDGAVYITNYFDDTISVCDISLSLCQKYTDLESLNDPSSISFDGSTAYITNFGDNSIAKCTFEGGGVLDCEPKIVNPNKFSRPMDIKVKSSRYYVANFDRDLDVSICNDDMLASCQRGAPQVGAAAGLAIL